MTFRRSRVNIFASINSNDRRRRWHSRRQYLSRSISQIEQILQSVSQSNASIAIIIKMEIFLFKMDDGRMKSRFSLIIYLRFKFAFLIKMMKMFLVKYNFNSSIHWNLLISQFRILGWWNRIPLNFVSFN